MMSANRLEDLWKAAHDGANSLVGPVAMRSRDDHEGILAAWFLERSHAVECEILLGQSGKLLRRIAAGGPLSVADQKRAKRLFRSIDRTLRPSGRVED